MKNKLLVILSLFIVSSIFSQNDSIVNYLDRNYKKVEKNDATYIQKIVKKDSLWLGTLYYSTGKVKKEGYFASNKLKKRVGLSKEYYKSGTLKSITKYNAKGKKDGPYIYFSEEGNNITSGHFLNGKREGLWKYLDKQGNKRARVVFKKGKTINYKLWDKKGTELNEKLILFRKPIFNGGLEVFKAKFHRELFLDLKREGLKTNFLVNCTINESGKVTNVSVSPTLDSVFNDKIINYFTNIKGVKPAIIANMLVKYPLKFPVILSKK